MSADDDFDPEVVASIAADVGDLAADTKALMAHADEEGLGVLAAFLDQQQATLHAIRDDLEDHAVDAVADSPETGADGGHRGGPASEDE